MNKPKNPRRAILAELTALKQVVRLTWNRWNVDVRHRKQWNHVLPEDSLMAWYDTASDIHIMMTRLTKLRDFVEAEIQRHNVT